MSGRDMLKERPAPWRNHELSDGFLQRPDETLHHGNTAMLSYRAVARRNATQNLEGIFGSRLFHVNRREAAREGRVSFNVLAVLDVGRRADARQLAPRERRLELVREIVWRISSSEERVHFVDEEHDLAVRPLHFEL